ncbi:MAG: hypothetical protein FIB01_02110 [Gemmatimonadetes bacterium]|nr:hypothetical protein [Gemmatimonadota bacterium]
MRFRGWRPLLVLAGALVLPAAAQAQEGFRFREPSVQLSLRFGADLPRVSGRLFDDMRDRLTLDAGNFAAENLGADVLFRVAPMLDLGIGLDYAESTAESEYRDFTFDDAQESPIQQVTKLRRVPLNALLRVYPAGRGESLARYAWVPKRFVPFVGGGLGVLWYRLEQEGHFVDEDTYDIFISKYSTDGAALAGHVLAGADYWVTPAIAFTAEGRYTFASADPGGDYELSIYNPSGYTSIDLSGIRLTAGLSFRF